MPNSVVKTLTVNGTTYDLKDVDSELYAPKASPALTGTPTAPTATSGANTTQIATTAFVQSAVSGAQEIMIVNLSYDENDDEYSVDKPFAEFYAFLNAGGYVFLFSGYSFIPVYAYDSNSIEFTSFYSEEGFIENQALSIYSDDTIGIDNVLTPGFWRSIVIGRVDGYYIANDVTFNDIDNQWVCIIDPSESNMNKDVICYYTYANSSIKVFSGVYVDKDTASGISDAVKLNLVAVTIHSNNTVTVNKFDINITGSLSSLSDVNISSATEGNVLYYSSYFGKWINGALTLPSASSSTPLMDGTAAVGTSTDYARGDHVHPTDTSRVASSDVLTKTNTTSFTPSGDYNPATKKYVDDSISSITTTLSGLTDTTISSPSNNQVLKYDSTSSKWVNGTISAASSVADLTDTTLTSLADGQFLKYDSTSSKWINVSLPVYAGEILVDGNEVSY